MTIQERKVTVKQLPETLSAKQRRAFLRDVQDSISAERPRIVLDCSSLRQLDNSAAYLLLCCLEEAMKSNGDVKLAALPPGTRTMLKSSRISNLFEIYETTSDAINSFHQIPTAELSRYAGVATAHPGPENAS